MNINNSVEVFLGNPISVTSEQQFLARLIGDLRARGVRARILANLELGRDDRQIDFVVITDHRVAQVELKTFSGPVLAGPKNGSWSVRVGDTTMREVRNPIYQARQATYAVSDALSVLAERGLAPRSAKGKFFREIDTVVCAYPVLPPGSQIDKHSYVSVVGYRELLDRLCTPGPTVPWSSTDWDAFGQRLNLYRADEDSPEGLLRRAGASVVDEYLGRYLHEHGVARPVVATQVVADGTVGERPDLTSALAAGEAALIHGASGTGKTVWARSLSAALAAEGHVPIWLAAELCDTSFRTALARGISAYTSLSPDELLKAADAAGRSVVFVVDDLTKASAAVQQALLDGVRAVRLRKAGRGVVLTAQSAEAAGAIPECRVVELPLPGDADRVAILTSYGAAGAADCFAPFVTPLELSLAASYLGELGVNATTTDLLDRHVEHLCEADDEVRRGLRSVARLMHDGMHPAPTRSSVARSLRRDHAFDDDALRRVFGCRALEVRHGRISFGHERFEKFMAAEASAVTASDAGSLAAVLNSPSGSALWPDVIALEVDLDRLGALIGACERPEVLVDAATGRLGPAAERVAETVLADAVNIASANTALPNATFVPANDEMFAGRWETENSGSAATSAQLEAIGRLLPRGRFVRRVARLLDLTDSMCAGVVADDGPRVSGIADQLFATTYAIGPAELPASVVVQAATQSRRLTPDDDEASTVAAEQLLEQSDGLGVLYLAAQLLHRPLVAPRLAEVIVRCLAAGPYHLTLIGLSLAEDCASGLEGPDRRAVVDAVTARLSDNPFSNSAVVEALSALGEISPNRTLDEVNREIATVLDLDGDPNARKLAYGIVASQFEDDVVGPYYEAVAELPAPERRHLLAMALESSEDGDGLSIAWIVNEFDDLSDFRVRDAVVSFVARSDPKRWFMVQHAMEAVVISLALLAADGIPLPDTDGGSNEPAWRAGLTIIRGAIAEERGHPREEATATAWALLTGERRDGLASLLCNLHHAGASWVVRDRPWLHDVVLAAMPAPGVEALMWSLEHRDSISPMARHDFGLVHYLVSVLGQLGDRAIAERLRRFAADTEIGEQVATAVREIETRSSQPHRHH